MEIISTVVVWAMLVFVSGMRFVFVPTLSDEERRRLLKLEDRLAQQEVEMLENTPLLASLKSVVQALLTVAFVLVATQSFGLTEGSLIATIGLVLMPITYRVQLFGRLSDWLQTFVEPWFLRILPSLKSPLSWLRDKDTATFDQRLNSQEELLSLIRRSPGILSKDEYIRLEASLAFDELKVGDIMTPRTMIAAIEVSETLGPLVLDELYKTGHSRFPVYKKDLDHIVGILYLRELVDVRQGERTVEKAMQPKVFYVNEDQAVDRALKGFLRTKHHLFVVVNSYRETVGVITLEDTLEALLGAKIEDEFDAYDDLRAVADSNPKDNNLPKKREDI